MKNLFEQRKVPTSITEKEVHSLASVLKVEHITEYRVFIALMTHHGVRQQSLYSRQIVKYS